jgi:organic hydroperoxide reductase OsmC/OhrA
VRASRELAFPVSIEWVEGRLVRASVEGKDGLDVATPPEFLGGIEGVWSPEDLLVAAAASCFAVTFVAVAEHRSVPVRGLAVEGVGRMAIRDGRLGFVGVDLRAEIETDPEQLEPARSAARRAEDGCFVSAALEIPVRLEVEVRPVGVAVPANQ